MCVCVCGCFCAVPRLPHWALRVWSGQQPVGWESSDWLCLATAIRAKWKHGCLLCVPPVLRAPPSVLQPASVWRASLIQRSPRSQSFAGLRARPLRGRQILPGNSADRPRGVVGRRPLALASTQVPTGEWRWVRVCHAPHHLHPQPTWWVSLWVLNDALRGCRYKFCIPPLRIWIKNEKLWPPRLSVDWRLETPGLTLWWLSLILVCSERPLGWGQHSQLSRRWLSQWLGRPVPNWALPLEPTGA